MTHRSPITPLQRWFLRMPITLYRIGLGGLFGQRFLLLQHRGRRSGAQHHTVLEVITHTATTYTVVSGWGARADWLRNVQRHPAVSIQVGTRTMVATAMRIDNEAATRMFHAYAQAHPHAMRTIGRLFLGADFRGTTDQINALGATLPVVTFVCAPTPS